MPKRPTHTVKPPTAPGPWPEGQTQRVRELGPALWRSWQGQALAAACAGPDSASWVQAPELARWKGLASFMTEGDDALACLDAAWLGFVAQGQPEEAVVTAQMALVFCLVDNGAASRTSDWLDRAQASREPPELSFWPCLGAVAQVALGVSDSQPIARAAKWLDEQLHSSQTDLSPDERLLCALILLEYRFATRRYDQILVLIHTVEVPALFEPASGLLRSRWALLMGHVHHLTGEIADAESGWRRALALAEQHGCHTVQLQARLALVRRMVDGNRPEEARAELAALNQHGGPGRVSQLIQLQQQRARLLMLTDQPARALGLLQDVLRLTEEAAWPEAEKSSCLNDQAQVLVALDRADEALALLQRLAAARQGRDEAVFNCLSGLMKAWQWRHSQPEASRQSMVAALDAAQQARMHTFFRLLPAMAGRLCALALQWQVQPHFVVEIIRNRQLPAPEDADSRWPWPLWLGLIGGFEWRLNGHVQRSSGKAQLKPLELLRLLACSRNLSLGMTTAAEALWPGAEAGADLRNLDVAIHRLRKLLGDASLVWVHDNRLGLDNRRVSSDLRLRRQLVERIEHLAIQPAAGDGSAASAANECRQSVARLMAMTTATLLPDAPDAVWLLAERNRFRQDTLRAALAAASLLARDPSDEAECRLLEAALNAEPLAEALVRRLAQAYQRAGLKGDAIRVVDAHLKQLRDAGSKPGSAVLDLRSGLLGD